MKTLYTLIVFLFCFITSCSSQSTDITGKWYGKADVGGFNMRIVFDITDSEDGYTATMLSPDQSDQEIPATTVIYEEDRLKITIQNIGFVYEGTVTKEGTIEGGFTQSGQQFGLNMSRKEIVSNNQRPQEPVPPFPYQVKEVTFFNEDAGIHLAGTLTIPRSFDNFTAVVLVSGSGPQNRDEELLGHKPFWVLADYLTRQGIAVLRFDDRGVGESEGIYEEANLSDFASDAKAAIDFLKTEAKINKDKIGVIGHSEGGAIAFMLAAQKVPAFIVTLAAPGVNGPDLLRMQRKGLFQASGIPDEYIDQFNDYMTKAQEIAVNAKDKQELRDGINTLFTGTPIEKQIEPAIQQLSSPEIVSFLKYDPKDYYKDIKCPVFALNGMRDMQVPSGENLSAILENIKANGNKEITTKPYFNLNHLFQTASTGLPNEYGMIEETFNTEAMDDIAKWILER